MIITALLIICAILFIIAMLHLTDTAYTKHDCKEYQEHIDDLVTELFPPSSTIQTPTPDEPNDPQEDTVQEDTVQYQEAKRKMVADIRTYFNQRKINAGIAKMPGPDELAPVNPFSKQTFLDPPSIERLME